MLPSRNIQTIKRNFTPQPMAMPMAKVQVPETKVFAAEQNLNYQVTVNYIIGPKVKI